MNSQHEIEAYEVLIARHIAVGIQVFFANLDDFAEMNKVYEEYFPQKPARSAIEAKRLPAGVSIEMELIALQ